MKSYFKDIKGMTLLELMVVVAIIGIALTIAIPNYIKMQPHMRLKAAARDIASTLNLARMTAISKNADQTVTFDDANDSFHYDKSHDASSMDWYRKVQINLPVGAPGRHATPSFGTTSGNPNKVTFDSYGRDKNYLTGNSEEAVYLTNIQPTGEEYRVLLDRAVGKTTVQHWNGVSEWVN
jgi:prepilin-type N-terminal cleavage/methylation domain-containing protein